MWRRGAEKSGWHHWFAFEPWKRHGQRNNPSSLGITEQIAVVGVQAAWRSSYHSPPIVLPPEPSVLAVPAAAEAKLDVNGDGMMIGVSIECASEERRA